MSGRCIDARVRECWDIDYYVLHHMVGGFFNDAHSTGRPVNAQYVTTEMRREFSLSLFLSPSLAPRLPTTTTTTSYYFPLTDFLYLTVYKFLFTIHYSLLTTHYLLLNTQCSLHTTHYSLLTTHYSLLTTHYHYSLLSTYYYNSRLTPSPSCPRSPPYPRSPR